MAARLVRLLLCRAGEPVTEDELIEAFWPDKAAAAGRRSLQVAVSAARGVLDAPGAEASRLVAGEHSYRLSLAPGRQRGRPRVRARGGGGAERAGATGAARRCSRPRPVGRRAAARGALLRLGDPLARAPDRPPRARCSRRSSTSTPGAGDLPAAADVARRLVELDPVNEAAHRQLIVAYARAGQRGHALRQYLACRRALVDELGVEPGEETAALQRRVLAGEPCERGVSAPA